ncbi:Borrelia lipoprotein-containing protein (plasmid) [Borrelia crocidurae str. Achema]|uniref:Variable large protein n=1 Tax=Borrelia crocidurae (strain Achema) TaxID=1155096 RepID=I0FDW9_BORCA|nr:Borrelia lipoprotein-containing protein [Borrelia crocidurae str. Achema]
MAAAGSGGVAGDGVEKIVKGIKGIVEVVLKGVGKADAGDSNKASDGAARTANAGDGEAGKLFATGNGPAGDQANSKKVATDAAKAVGGVRGSDILQVMVKENSDATTLAKNSSEQVVGADKVDAVIAGGIALRAMSKGGKFANGTAGNDVSAAVKGAAVSAVTKALDTLTVAIRKTIDLGLKNVKDSMRINSNATPVVSDKDASGAKNQ